MFYSTLHWPNNGYGQARFYGRHVVITTYIMEHSSACWWVSIHPCFFTLLFFSAFLAPFLFRLSLLFPFSFFPPFSLFCSLSLSRFLVFLLFSFHALLSSPMLFLISSLLLSSLFLFMYFSSHLFPLSSLHFTSPNLFSLLFNFLLFSLFSSLLFTSIFPNFSIHLSCYAFSVFQTILKYFNHIFVSEQRHMTAIVSILYCEVLQVAEWCLLACLLVCLFVCLFVCLQMMTGVKRRYLQKVWTSSSFLDLDLLKWVRELKWPIDKYLK